MVAITSTLDRQGQRSFTSDLAKTSQGKYTHASHLCTRTHTHALTHSHQLMKTVKTGAMVSEDLIFTT